MTKVKCTGHICFWAHLEYFEVPSGHVYQAPSNNLQDPAGYRLGATPYVYKEYRRSDMLEHIQKLIDRYPEMVAKAVYKEDGDVLILPSSIRTHG